MLSKEISIALSKQIKEEASASQTYLAMASWLERKGLPGLSDFFYAHSEEERQHMIKLIHYLNERGEDCIIPALEAPKSSYKNVKEVLKDFHSHEQHVTKKICEIVDVCLEKKDFTTYNFMQWYVNEQMEEEATAQLVLDKFTLLGENPEKTGGLFLLDKEASELNKKSSNN